MSEVRFVVEEQHHVIGDKDSITYNIGISSISKESKDKIIEVLRS